MNKQSVMFVAIGVLIIVGIGYVIFKPKDNTSIKTNTPASGGTNSNTETTEQPPQGPAPIAVAIDYKDGVPFEPQPIHATENQEVVITVSADVTDEVHLHGYDISEKVTPDKPAILIIMTKETGRFELELEGKKKILGALEVHPR